jgi:hypothetical protein
MGWLCGARQMQKNVTLRFRQVNNFALVRISTKSMYGFETSGCRVTVAELIAQRS